MLDAIGPPVMVVVNALGVTLIYAICRDRETPEEQVLGEPLVGERSERQPRVEPLDADAPDDR